MDNGPKVPGWKPKQKFIRVTIKVNGLKYGANFDLDTDPDEIGRLTAETVREAPKRSWAN